MEKRHRIFIAVNMPHDIKKELGKYEEKWPEIPAKWTNKDNLHITLEFLGQINDEELADACAAVSEVAKRHKTFSINLNKVSYGPPKKMPPKMVWVEGENSKDLADLKNDLQETLLEKIRFRPDGKGFTPHITLARISECEFRKFELDEIPEVSEDLDFIFSVESIEVMESELKRGGPQYTIIESHELQN
jgi:2'-5' RNA ligase